MHRDTKKTESRFVVALALTGLILIAEVAGGLLTHSLALLSDAAHVLLDMLALGMSYVALRLATRPADDRHTYGYHRFEVLAALANGVVVVPHGRRHLPGGLAALPGAGTGACRDLCSWWR